VLQAVLDMFRNAVPDNAVAAAAEGNVLGVVSCALVAGAALAAQGEEASPLKGPYISRFVFVVLLRIHSVDRVSLSTRWCFYSQAAGITAALETIAAAVGTAIAWALVTIPVAVGSLVARQARLPHHLTQC
jgi:Na+/H+-dicarboxylate symporter